MCTFQSQVKMVWWTWLLCLCVIIPSSQLGHFPGGQAGWQGAMWSTTTTGLHQALKSVPPTIMMTTSCHIGNLLVTKQEISVKSYYGHNIAINFSKQHCSELLIKIYRKNFVVTLPCDLGDILLIAILCKNIIMSVFTYNRKADNNHC